MRVVDEGSCKTWGLALRLWPWEGDDALQQGRQKCLLEAQLLTLCEARWRWLLVNYNPRGWCSSLLCYAFKRHTNEGAAADATVLVLVAGRGQGGAYGELFLESLVPFSALPFSALGNAGHSQPDCLAASTCSHEPCCSQETDREWAIMQPTSMAPHQGSLSQVKPHVPYVVRPSFHLLSASGAKENLL